MGGRAGRARIVAERYAERFFGGKSLARLVEWTKTGDGGHRGTLIRDGRLALDQDGLRDIWAGDRAIGDHSRRSAVDVERVSNSTKDLRRPSPT